MPNTRITPPFFYTDRNELAAITAPGNKTWTYHYNDLGQPTSVDIPNGMTTEYTYDTRNRLTAIAHKDGTTVLDGYTYTLSDGGNIVRTDQADGSYWEYEYDDRDRLTDAVRSHPGGNIQARYAYTYDAGDNMVSKTEPYLDDFNDGTYSGWTISGSMSAASNYLESTGTGAPVASLSSTDASNEALLRYRINDTSDSQTRAYVVFRFTDWSNYEWVRISPSSINIGKVVSGTATQITSGSVASIADTWYNLRVVADGASVQVYRWADGAMPTLVCSTTSSPNQSTSSFKIAVNSGYLFDFDDIRILADDLSNTTTFAVNNANELTSMTDPNGTTTFTYDAWGRMTGKARGSYAATYGYRYGDKLQSVTSSFPEEGAASFEYGGDSKRRARTASGNSTFYRWDAEWSAVSEMDFSGSPTAFYIFNPIKAVGTLLAEVNGSNPSTTPFCYFYRDYVGSSRQVRDESLSLLGAYDFAPYGGICYQSGMPLDFLSSSFSGRVFESSGQMYYFPYRYFSPSLGNWLVRDPLGTIDGPNRYQYVSSNPVVFTDDFGLFLLAGCATGAAFSLVLDGAGAAANYFTGGVPLTKVDACNMALNAAAGCVGGAIGAGFTKGISKALQKITQKALKSSQRLSEIQELTRTDKFIDMFEAMLSKLLGMGGGAVAKCLVQKPAKGFCEKMFGQQLPVAAVSG